jgi:hypothetical protein
MNETLKMTIMGFTDPKFMVKAFIPPFQAHVNPDSYSQSVEICFSDIQAQGTSANNSKQSHTKPRELSFDLLLDRTGALGNTQFGPLGVEVDIKHFKELTLDYEGSIHKPRYLVLLWGTLIFFCQLKSLSVEYKMFNKSGVPVRAILKTTFREFIEPKLRTLFEGKSSPDLTHVRTVKEGDTLPMLAFEIYGDSAYYMEVARVNNIINFRNLEPGREIIFPPIEKLETA